MAFELGDVRGKRNSKDDAYVYKERPVNMLDKSQNAMNDEAREGYDSAFVDKALCKKCRHYGLETDTCLVPYSRRLCND
jgi:hypothetical protein